MTWADHLAKRKAEMKENRPMPEGRGAGVTESVAFKSPTPEPEPRAEASSELECQRLHFAPAGSITDPDHDGYWRIYVREGVEVAPNF